MPKDIGATLKKLRMDAGISVKEISDILVSKGFKAGESTIYSWENNNSNPTPGALLVMCKAYNVDNVLSAFGYDGYNSDGTICPSIDEIEMIKKYRTLDEHGTDMVDTVLEKEYQRYQTQSDDKVVQFVVEQEPAKLAARNKYKISQEQEKRIVDILNGNE